MLSLRRYLIAGLLVWLPLGVTVLIVKLMVDLLDRTLLLLPANWRPDAVLGFTIPGFGVVLAVAILLLTGMLVANFLGKRLIQVWEMFLARIPLVRSIYTGVKQVVETIFSSGGKSFRQVLLIEYPRPGLWSFAFLTNDSLGEVAARLDIDVISVFLPTTPNPTSGFVLVVPKADAIELDMSVDEALKLIMSVGVVVPNWSPDDGSEPVANAPDSP